MGLFDIFTDENAKAAAAAQTAGLNAGNALATGNINVGTQALTTDYTKALQPYLQNYGQATAGTTQLGNVLGLNGQPGSDQAMQFLQNTPGYQFQKQQGDDAINAQAAATGMNASGNQALALAKFNQGLAGTTYNNYVSQLQPFLGAAGNAAGGIANVNTGLGNATANQNNMLAGLNYQTQTGIGNANANADLAANTASGNFWNLLGGLGGAKTTGGGTIGGNMLGSFGGSGGFGPTSVGGAPLSGGGSGILGGIGSLVGSIFSDERLKEDITPVGELFDGQEIFRYRYLGEPVWRIGLMAQNVEETVPEAVSEVGGFKTVEYKKATDFAATLSQFL